MAPKFTPGIDYKFKPGKRPARPFLYRGDRLLVKIINGAPAPIAEADLAPLDIANGKRLALGRIGREACWAHHFKDEWRPPSGWQFEGLRSLFGRMDEASLEAAGYGLQILKWAEAHRFCGQCGALTTFRDGERALQCTGCAQTLFPQISPAVIVAVTSQGRLLLARSGRFAGRMFSVIAGYVEPGETLEECVRREVREEVGLEIGNIRYFGSQPWPFSGSLMVAFTATHTGGVIAVDHREILEAGWFTADNLPEIPGRISIARRLIDGYLDHHG
ncbi:MAG: NAD(+) diphosphatase [Desulfosarcina sp.]|nr:NAD(+) diphosphatase [Desulfobacterales bacterium]